jgi:hypothetical protein
VKIDPKEIERIIDDLETKQSQLNPNVAKAGFTTAYKELGQYEAYDYCIALLRQVTGD